jgi:hypothetical protein
MIDDDYVIEEFCRSHLQAQLLLHGDIKGWRCVGIIGRRGHHRTDPSELGELGFVRSPFQFEIVSTGKPQGGSIRRA